MTPQERDLILSLFGRLQQTANQTKDREAEDLIRQGVAAHPDAPYLLVQTVLIQDMALSDAHNRIKDMEQQLAAAHAAPQTQAQPTSFLAGGRGSVPAAGPWGQAPAAPSPAQGPVWTQSGAVSPQAPAPAPAPSLAMPGASSGFLRQAATTAAGVAGGALLFEGIRSLFGPHYGSGFLAGMPSQPGLGETVINNYYGNAAPDAGDPQQANADWSNDPNLTQADTSQDYDPGQDMGDQDFGSDQDTGGGDTFDV